MGHNLKGQEDDLIEDLPVGLRRARLCCVVSCTVVAALLSLVTLALLIWAMTVLDVDTYGPEGAVFRDRAVGFLKPVECTGQVAIGQGDYVVRSTANEPLNVAAADSYRLTARSATARSTSSISSTPADVTFNASKMTARSAVNESDIYFEMDPEQSYVRSRRAFFDTPAVRTAGNAKVGSARHSEPRTFGFKACASYGMASVAYACMNNPRCMWHRMPLTLATLRHRPISPVVLMT
ncbi:uncharacterized protein MONBRDRAFT_23397 [Monosiga brevicollis MX1]|uniref:Uncharacterized protein n=1 Tax=Monosiga brevicollis TaxID=81824 RepID=A9UTA0_MONBE|nr:uncharacterized protein MONBRDRAFT_23397 [Monosiga brevicollis MX1]EDQ91210.1 predicted protein [Monosiga brevicollis MX1]|eukprot:XP_001743632.1 hypothetical protein [Monosiga brevicollis MX1]